MAQSSSIEIPISTELLNCLRSFNHEHHAYKKEFLEALDSILLLCFQKTQCVSSIDELSFEAVFLGVHYYLSLIINIGELINRYDEDRQVTEMNLRAINSTNIFNIHSLSNALQNQRKISQRKSSTQELNLSVGNSQISMEDNSARFLKGFRLYLTKEDVQVDGSSLYLPCDMLVRAMKSNGRINMEFVSFICHELNQALGLSLSHYLASSESNSDLSLNVDSKDTYTCNDFYTHMTLFLQEKDQELLLTALNNLESKVISAIKYLDYESQALLKRLFVALLGHNSPIIRERSAIYLNMINDGVEWVLEVTQKTQVATVGDEFIISHTLHTLDSSSIELSDPMFLLHASPFGVNNKGNPVFSMHKPDIRVDSDTQELTVNLGKFSKPGFYHWKLINVCGAAIQGKFVVHPKGTRDLGVHEVSAKDSLVLVKENIVHYMRTGINCICVKGDISSKEEEIRSLVQAAKEINIKVVVDFKSTLNADELTNEFGDVVLKEINENNEELGLAKNQAKEMFLNMRRREAWDLVIEQAVNLVQKYGLSGLSLENVQNWPQVFDIDQREMAKNEVDGRQKYTLEENFFGDIISSTQNDPDYSFTSTNPFLAELCNSMWQTIPSLVLIGEITSSQDLETKQRSLIGSGIIPKLHQNSPFIAEIFGKRINKYGVYVNSSPSSDNLSNLLQQMNEETLPSGAIIIQSISTYSLPHPLYIFERGIFAFIDMMFFLPQIPSTCMNEIKGHCYKYNTAPSQRSQNITPFFDDTELEESDQDRIINDTEGVLTSIEECIKAQEKFQKKFGIEYGLTPQKIQSHYEERRHMRRNYEALRAGKMIPLTVESEGETSNKVFSFVRATSKETLVVAVNFNEFDVRFNVDTKKVLQHIVSEMDQKGIMQCVVKIQDCGKDSYPSYYTAFEFLFGKIDLSLKPYTSLVWSIDIICNDEELYNKTLVYSLQRVKYQTMRNEKVEGHEVIELLTSTVKNTNNIQEFACKLDYINKNFLKPAGIYISDLLNTVKDFQQNSALSEKLFAFCTVLKEYFPQASEDDTASSSNGSDMHAFKTTEITFMHDDFLPSELVDIRNDFRSSIEIARDVLDHNTLGPIALISPELGRWSTVGGLGVMVDELSIGLAQLGEDVICVSPYYDKNRKGETNYLAKDPDGIRYVFNIEVEINNEKHVLGIHYGVIKGVKLYFIHHAMIFPHIYVGGDAKYTTLQISLLAKASLQLLSVIDKLPSLVITNDWFTGLVAAYAKNGHFEKVFSQTKFLHIIHNLDTAYEGRQYPSYEERNLENIHGLPSYLLVNPQWFDTIINPSRCAILASDKWATVSATYKNEILTKSDLADVLVVSPNPFAVSNGILKENRLSLIKKVCNGDHLKAKEIIQKKYFKFPRMDNSYAIFAFVGRITYQKGVIHILEAIEELLVKSNFSIQFIIGGMASPNDPYGSACAALMKDLMSAYPKNVWAGPYEFFTDGTLLNVGADFALMPSIFEPGGIVQHEFFVGSTPVIASQTGGLADTVFEFNVEAEEGNGFTMESSNKQNIIDAVTRACEVYNQPSKYQALRKQAFKSVIDVESVAKAWNREFYKLFGKVFMEAETIRPHIEAIDRTFSDNKIECRPTFDSIIQQKILGEIKPKQVCHVSRYAESEKVSNKDFDVAYYEERRSEQEQDKYRHKLSLDEKVCLVNTEVVDQSVTCSMEVA